MYKKKTVSSTTSSDPTSFPRGSHFFQFIAHKFLKSSEQLAILFGKGGLFFPIFVLIYL